MPVRRGRSASTSESTEKVSVVGESIAASEISTSSRSTEPTTHPRPQKAVSTSSESGDAERLYLSRAKICVLTEPPGGHAPTALTSALPGSVVAPLSEFLPPTQGRWEVHAMASTALAGAPARSTAAEQAKGDVLVVFGITGDLAKVMTFRSLYRLEARGL